MSDLHQLLTEAVPAVEPGFDEADVRARIARVERRNRRILSVAAVLVVVVVTSLVATGLRLDQPTALVDDVVPVSQWPDSVDFVGVEIDVELWEEPPEPLEHRVPMGSGTAALTSQPSDLLEPGNTWWQRFQHRLWFSCGGHVVRMVEAGRAEGAPGFTIPAPPGRWLPAGALIEAGRRLTESIGCEPAAPAGAPAEVQDAQPWVGELAAAMEEAGLVTCCANPTSAPPNDWFLNDWGVLLDNGDRLSLSVGRVGTDYVDDHPVEVVQMAGGQAWQRIDPSSPADVVELVCGDAHIVAHHASGGAVSVERFLDRIGCIPEVPTTTATNEQTSNPTAAASPEAAAFIDRIRAAGLAVSDVVSDDQATTFHARPTAPTASPVWVSIDTDARWDVDGTTPLIPIGEGEVAEIDGGTFGMTCDGLAIRTTGPSAGGSTIPDVEEVLAVAGCTPAPPGTTVSLPQPDGTTMAVPASIREARLFAATETLGMVSCCGEPAHGAPAASIGVVWDSAEVRIEAGPPARADGWMPAARVIDLADGQADLGDGDGLPAITFVCGDTLYTLTVDATGDPHIAVAEALVGQLACTPNVTW